MTLEEECRAWELRHAVDFAAAVMGLRSPHGLDMCTDCPTSRRIRRLPESGIHKINPKCCNARPQDDVWW